MLWAKGEIWDMEERVHAHAGDGGDGKKQEWEEGGAEAEHSQNWVTQTNVETKRGDEGRDGGRLTRRQREAAHTIHTIRGGGGGGDREDQPYTHIRASGRR